MKKTGFGLFILAFAVLAGGQQALAHKRSRNSQHRSRNSLLPHYSRVHRTNCLLRHRRLWSPRPIWWKK